MSERYRFRGQDPRNVRRNWFNPNASFGQGNPRDEIRRAMASYLSPAASGDLGDIDLGDIGSQGAAIIVPSTEGFGVENLKFIGASREVTTRMDLISHGTRKQRESAQRYLIDYGCYGTTDNFLDVTNAALVSILRIKKPQVVGILQNVGVDPEISTTSLKNLRSFLLDFTRALSKESRVYTVDLRRMSTDAKLIVAHYASLLFVQTLSSQEEFYKLPFGLTSLLAILGVSTARAINTKITIFNVTIAAETSEKDLERIEQISKKDSQEISQDEFDLALKVFSFRSAVNQTSDLGSSILNKFFERLQPEQIARTLSLFNTSLNSTDPQIRNSAMKVLTSPFAIGRPKIETVAQLRWLSSLQEVLGRMADGDETIAEQLRTGLEALIYTLNKYDRGKFIILLRDHEVMISSLETVGEEVEFIEGYTQQLRIDLIKKIEDPKIENTYFELLLRGIREHYPDQIEKELLTELFDERRPLGFFLDNLRVSWQDLQRVTREGIWPSFITARGAKVWPGENELPVLEFPGRHPAAVLGFSGLRFYMRGYARPEVGVAFSFKDIDEVLTGRIDNQGRLVDTPFDIEESDPHIHSLLEHFAVSSFQSLVTIASRRIHVRGEEGRVPTGEGSAGEYQISLPRHEISYIDLVPRPRRITVDEVIENERRNARLAKPITQKVVPLPYAQRYRYYRGRLTEERAKGNDASSDRIKEYEAGMMLNLSLIPNPSGLKLDNLPPEFQLEQTNTGKYLETWRKNHTRPKQKDGEDFDISTVYERNYRAAPSLLTKHLETWFTQPPRQQYF